MRNKVWLLCHLLLLCLILNSGYCTATGQQTQRGGSSEGRRYYQYSPSYHPELQMLEFSKLLTSPRQGLQLPTACQREKVLLFRITTSNCCITCSSSASRRSITWPHSPAGQYGRSGADCVS